MRNNEYIEILKHGVSTWNRWREKNPEIKPYFDKAEFFMADLGGINFSETSLSEANLSNAYLRRANLTKAYLRGANLCRAYLSEPNLCQASLYEANLSGAYLNGANLRETSLNEANLSGADLTETNLYKTSFYRANLSRANLRRLNLANLCLSRTDLSDTDLFEANLSGADLTRAVFVEANLDSAWLTNCYVYGISAWNIKGKPKDQSNLVITRPGENPIITVDDLEVAQFIYLLLNHEKIRNVISTITTKAVLILGRFTPERKAVLDALRRELREHNLLPIMFDFDQPATRDTHETVTILARLARFIIADITDPRSIPQEIISIVESVPSVPIQPLLQLGNEPWGMFDHIKRYPWVLSIYYYHDLNDLLSSLGEKVIAPAEAKAKDLRKVNESGL